MIDISSFERTEYEKMMATLGIEQTDGQNSGEIKSPDRDYLMAWDFGYVKKNGRSSAEAI